MFRVGGLRAKPGPCVSVFAAALAVLVLGWEVLASVTSAAEPSVRGRDHGDEVVAFINEQIRQGWADNEIEPSPRADDAEWLRRVYLDIVGAIPPADVVDDFLRDKSEEKRSAIVERLLEDPAYVRNWTTIWTNLMIGRETPRRTSRDGMEKFLRAAFARNRPWNEVVEDVVTATGHYEENGAVNYLLAQMTMRDDGVQATAKTTRLFMGIQIQCTQCHNHPFNDWQQSQFWEFNSFFRQIRRVDHRRLDQATGRQVDDYSELLEASFGGEVFFEKRNGMMQVAYPKYFDKTINPGPEIDRRAELARLMFEGEHPYVALAYVNRLWEHFLGFGFTRPVDDMGPHNPVSHPDLLARLADEFIASGYDTKTLIRWICNTEAYQLTSRFGENNEVDNPAVGETPLFSHVYLKSLQAEQLYDSLLVATNAGDNRVNWDDAERQREAWMQQFVLAFGTDEGDEASTFNGTIPQALMMMNGDLINAAISTESGSLLSAVLSRESSDQARLRRLYLATLSRNPTRRESSKALQLIRARGDVSGYQDVLWALLNSNEFITNH